MVGYNVGMEASELRLRIQRSGKTRSQAAEELGNSLNTLNAWCKGVRAIPEHVADVVRGWVQHSIEMGTGGVEVVPIEPVSMGTGMGTEGGMGTSDGYKPDEEDWETGYVEITEEYAKSLGYGVQYKGEDWFRRAKEAIIASRRLGAMRGKDMSHPRWKGVSS